MNSIEIQNDFGFENLKMVEKEPQEPQENEVLLRMKAVSLNYRDLLMIQGHYDPKLPLPITPCSDGVGVVEKIGKNVSTHWLGKRVCPIFAQKWTSGEPTFEKLRSTLGGPLSGTLTEFMTCSADGIVEVPEYLSDAAAATLPCAALTAWSSLVTLGQTKAGDTVLVQGTGGVSIFALQLAKTMGAKVIATSSEDAKLRKCEELGADLTIHYKKDEQWGKTAHEWTSKKGVDHIVEVGGGKTLEQSLKAIRFGGFIGMIGVLSGVSSQLNLLPILMKQIRIQGVLVGHKEGFESMMKAFSAHRIQPQVDQVFDWKDYAKAFQHLQSGKHFGKVCIQIS